MKSDRKNWTGPQLPALTGSQVKALLLVASESRLQAEPLGRHADEIERLLAEMGRLQGTRHSNLLATALDPATSVNELTWTKELAKTFIKDESDATRLDAARLLYHAAVAAALVHHGRSISGRPVHKQHALYEKLAETWAGHAVGDLFHEAAARARQP